MQSRAISRSASAADISRRSAALRSCAMVRSPLCDCSAGPRSGPSTTPQPEGAGARARRAGIPWKGRSVPSGERASIEEPARRRVLAPVPRRNPSRRGLEPEHGARGGPVSELAQASAASAGASEFRWAPARGAQGSSPLRRTTCPPERDRSEDPPASWRCSIAMRARAIPRRAHAGRGSCRRASRSGRAPTTRAPSAPASSRRTRNAAPSRR